MGSESKDSPPMFLVQALEPYFFLAAAFFAGAFFAGAFAAAFFFGAAFLAGAAFFAGAFLVAILGHPLSTAVGGR
jgi:hypothetical protein